MTYYGHRNGNANLFRDGIPEKNLTGSIIRMDTFFLEKNETKTALYAVF
jgi:hypothetical protein